MQTLPDFKCFAATWAKGESALLWTEVSADLETPVTMYLKLVRAAPSFLLESVTGGESRGRYSVLGLTPDLIWRCRNNQAAIADGVGAPFREERLPPLDSLRELLAKCRLRIPESLPPMAAGLFGYLAYDMVRLVETIPDTNPDPLELPDSVLVRPQLIAIIDNVMGQAVLAAPCWNDGGDGSMAYQQAADRLRQACSDLDHPLKTSRGVPSQETAEVTAEPVSNFTREEYHQIVAQAKAYIAAGDIFQVVPSQRWTMPFTLPPLALYRALRRTNPSPYMFLFDFDDFQIVGASPEILVRVRDRKVTIRPIAGTRPRGKTPQADRELEAELLADPKECAEHLMLLDLGRNDVGRVAKIGTVKLTEQFTVERFSHVMHISSNVEGILLDEYSALDALLAGLPAGTLSGAPKIRAMEIIDELETVRRGVYGGGVGYFSAGGDMDTCIGLRAAVLKDGQIHIQAGGGVVADSVPASEYQETVDKTRAMRLAARDAVNFVPTGNAPVSAGSDPAQEN